MLALRRTMKALLLLAAGLAFFGQPFPALVVVALAVPVTVRYVRRELALGALIADDRRVVLRAQRLPARDLRSVDRSIL